MTDTPAQRAIVALIEAEMVDHAGLALHADAVRRAIDGSGLPLATRLHLRERIDRRVAGAALQVN